MRVVTVGSFDPVHDGHRALFAQMRRIAGHDEVVVGVNSDAFYEHYRGEKPMMAQRHRVAAIEALTDVDVVYVNDDPELQTALIADCAPAILLIGMDWARDAYLTQIGAPTWNWFEDHGIEICFVPRHGTISGTQIREAIRG